MTRERNQIRVLCNDCGCYYYWDIDFDLGDYSNNVNLTPQKAGVCCPECDSQVMATQAHHSAGTFNAEAHFTDRVSRYMSGPGSLFEPIKVDVAEKDGN